MSLELIFQRNRFVSEMMNFLMESNFVQFNKTRFIDFVDCRTNNVVTIDNINQQFSNLESSPDRFLNIDNISTIEKFDTYLIRIESVGNENQLQLSGDLYFYLMV